MLRKHLETLQRVAGSREWLSHPGDACVKSCQDRALKKTTPWAYSEVVLPLPVQEVEEVLEEEEEEERERRPLLPLFPTTHAWEQDQDREDPLEFAQDELVLLIDVVDGTFEDAPCGL